MFPKAREFYNRDQVNTLSQAVMSNQGIRYGVYNEDLICLVNHLVPTQNMFLFQI